MITNDKKQWNQSHEQLLANWANKANCYVWLHEKTFELYKKRNMYFSIPIIILSTISGTANYGISSIFPNFDYGNIIIGTMGLIVAIISFINNFLRHAELAESHKISSVQWSKYHRQISAELAITPNNRQDATEFILICKTEIDRLLEQSPMIPKYIQKFFKRLFINKINFEIPTELDNINPVYIYNEQMNMDTHFNLFKNNITNTLIYPPSIDELHNDSTLYNKKKFLKPIHNKIISLQNISHQNSHQNIPPQNSHQNIPPQNIPDEIIQLNSQDNTLHQISHQNIPDEIIQLNSHQNSHQNSPQINSHQNSPDEIIQINSQEIAQINSQDNNIEMITIIDHNDFNNCDINISLNDILSK